MRLLLADENTRRMRSLRESMEDYGIGVVGEAATGPDAVRLARVLRPEVTLLSLSLPGVGGVEATQAIVEAAPAARVLVLASSAEEDDVLDALIAGACGYLLEDAQVVEIVSGVRAAAAGDTMISPVVATRLVSRLREQRRTERVQAPPKPPPLTDRERDILRLLAQGRANSVIAGELLISPATVKTHVAHLLEKLGLDNRVQAAVFAVRHGIG